MKIICKDNFCREYISEKLIAKNVPSFYAKCIKDALNEEFGGSLAQDFFDIEADNYVLYIFNP
ncbi:unnamed protein product [marine sediment metagenome]|uniref:Uncharacterized protein n=1 Tax=marine sediment metagenome TaxID=412755 RepID=X0RUC0_9ZZZZ